MMDHNLDCLLSMKKWDKITEAKYEPITEPGILSSRSQVQLQLKGLAYWKCLDLLYYLLNVHY